MPRASKKKTETTENAEPSPNAAPTEAAAPKTKTKTKAKRKPRTKAKAKAVAVAVATNEVVTDAEPPATDAKKSEDKKKKKKKRSFRLYGFNPENGRAPQGGGYYQATSPQLSAKKAANRWVCPKDVYDEVVSFRMREVTSGSSKSIYEFKAKRVKLDKPKSYKRGDKEITVNSKIVIVE